MLRPRVLTVDTQHFARSERDVEDMMKRLSLLSLLLILLFSVVGAAGAQDIVCPGPIPTCRPNEVCPPIIICPPPPGGVATNPEWLKIEYHRVRVDIDSQIATTSVDMQFVNEGQGLAEGTFVFPLPADASVNQLTMYINDQPIEARILEAEEARDIYDAIVRQYRDPALLEYIGMQAVQANVFPIPPGEKRRIVIEYSQVLEADNGLIHYVYPFDVTRVMARRPVEEASISLNVRSADAVSTIYSPSHNIAISRDDDNRGFRAGFEANDYTPDQDFSLYYGIESEAINVNLLTFRESASEDGYFMLLVQPPLRAPETQIVPRDLIIVLDQSGSMSGEKWTQARDAAIYVLDHLNPQDRFNIVLFSTGWRIFSRQLEGREYAREASDWLMGMYAEGGTDINGSLLTALDMAHEERPTTILFLTDGLATEGETNTEAILSNVGQAAGANIRIFTFGVGDDVDTFLLDALVRNHRGASSYVRPSERIDEEVASLFNKIGAPVLADVELTIDGVTYDSLYPGLPMPDLFAGTQLTIVGRYRDGADHVAVSLSGSVNGERQTFVYDNLSFRDRSGGEPFIARLWATRRIGELMNTIRLNGENPELIDSIVSLSIRYGIITPYTSFLIEEDDILSQTGRDEAAVQFEGVARGLSANASGADAVSAADAFGSLQAAEAPSPMMPMATMTPAGTMTPGQAYDDRSAINESPLRAVGGKTFILQGEVWTDTTFEPDTMETVKVVFLSDAYFDLLDADPLMGEYLALGERIIVVLEGVAYETVSE